jgi:hypothetical protein
MKKNYTIVLALGLCILLAVSGCVIHIGDWPRAKYEKTITLQAPLESGSTVVANTNYGSIKVGVLTLPIAMWSRQFVCRLLLRRKPLKLLKK